MSRLTSIKRLAIAALATAGFIAACRAAQPGEAPPLAPRPDIGPSTDPVPGAPDPLDPPGLPGPTIPTTDAGPAPLNPTNPGPGPVSQISPPIYGSSASSAIPMQPDRDAGTVDAGGSDARRDDAGRDGDAPRDAATDALRADAGSPPRDGRVPDARDGGVGFPPSPDATLPLPGDAARPLR